MANSKNIREKIKESARRETRIRRMTRSPNPDVHEEKGAAPFNSRRHLELRPQTSVPDQSRKRAEPSQEWQRAYRKALEDYGSRVKARRIAMASVRVGEVGEYEVPHSSRSYGREQKAADSRKAASRPQKKRKKAA